MVGFRDIRSNRRETVRIHAIESLFLTAVSPVEQRDTLSAPTITLSVTFIRMSGEYSDVMADHTAVADDETETETRIDFAGAVRDLVEQQAKYRRNDSDELALDVFDRLATQLAVRTKEETLAIETLIDQTRTYDAHNLSANQRKALGRVETELSRARTDWLLARTDEMLDQPLGGDDESDDDADEGADDADALVTDGGDASASSDDDETDAVSDVRTTLHESEWAFVEREFTAADGAVIFETFANTAEDVRATLARTDADAEVSAALGHSSYDASDTYHVLVE